MVKTRRIILVLNNIRSIHNVGSILRTAEALGLKEIVYSGYTPYPEVENDERILHLRNKISRAINKTSLDAEYNLKHIIVQDINSYLIDMKNQGFLICSLEQYSGSIKLNNFKNNSDLILVLGNEVNGVDKDILKISDFIIEIPQKGKKESLNVVQAAAIAIYSLTN